MKLINFKRDQDWGQDFYLQILFTKRWAFFQGSVSWCKCPGWPFLQIQSGSGSLLSIIFDVYKLGIFLALFDRTWKL